MPLFMDFHLFTDEINIQGVKEAHVADRSVQDKYGVKYHQFWVNEKARTVFCLMEGPDRETCEQVHKEAHGNVACEIVEVEGGFYDVFLGNSHRAEGGLVRQEDGKVDNANRFILVVDIIANSKVKGPLDLKNIKLPEVSRKLIIEKIEHYNGNEVRQKLGGIIGLFISADEALRCAVDIQKTLNNKMQEAPESEWDVRYRIGLSNGQPVTENKEFLEDAITQAQRLCFIANRSEIVVSGDFERLCRFNQNTTNTTFIRVIHSNELQFLDNFFTHTERNLANSKFNINSLSSTIGVSRPQLYRKITSITGRSPNNFIRDLKMDKALNLIKEKRLNISEIALEVGYNNPSYFSKCFQEKFGLSPSQVTSV